MRMMMTIGVLAALAAGLAGCTYEKVIRDDSVDAKLRRNMPTAPSPSSGNGGLPKSSNGAAPW